MCIRFLCGLIDWTIIHTAEKDDLKTHESTIKTAAPRGALRLFCNYVSVDVMPGIEYDDRGLRCGLEDIWLDRIQSPVPDAELH